MTSEDARHALVNTHTEAAGLSLFARVSALPLPPQAPAVVMVHGLVVSSRYMVPTAKRLARYCRVAIPDLPGYGHSAKPPRALNVPQLADALAAWMVAAGFPRAVLLGNSFGCQVVVDLAVRYPERVARAILVGPTTDPRARTAHQQVGRWLLNLPGEPLGLGLVVARDVWDMGIPRALATFRHMLRDDVAAKLPRVQAPTLVVRGGHDTSVPQRWCEEAVRLLPRARLVVIPGAAHTLNYNSPRRLLRVTLPFILGHDAGYETCTPPYTGADR
ncbi:MAG TPA: alpha/beta hydrolase [Chloroflexota bacterium]|nr:alpha/beta hydrolase [Chloroflexota bacterium]